MRHRKADVDKKRSKLFSKLCREITAAAREGGDNPDSNLRLAYAIDKAKASNLPRDNIENSLKRATDSSTSEAMETVWYEGRAPGGVAVLIQALTENRKRTAPQLRSIFSKAGGELGASGSVSWMFETQGVCVIGADAGHDADEVVDGAIDAGADDVDVDDDGNVTAFCEPKEVGNVRDALTAAGFPPSSVEVRRTPQTVVEVDSSKEEAFARFLDQLDEQDDVQEVFHNADDNGDEGDADSSEE